ncbi:hypothetical protein IPA_07580 [Ignicoccus pacificus DSM 13166]|uniref:PIN domain-containing protein n=1 Tax=Ignicoccus pacificus DSM 13166 TaxID=940294 RepID=A0A977PKC1_9CREN|nr:hypothetical protein IPA_07580 [Ignicoccus pacificus DSM 13166]
MTDFLDTSFIISYVVEDDVNHEKVRNFKIGKGTVTPLVYAELISFFSRVANDPKVLAKASLSIVRARIVDVSLAELISLMERFSSLIKLRTLDTLHLLSSYLLNCDRFITLDKEISKKANLISKLLNVEVVNPLEI